VDKIQNIKTFLRVAEMRSFTKAAESLGLPKASVSVHIQQLENELGTRLFHRTTRSVQLTQDGSAFYERGKDVLADLSELGSMFNRKQELSGRIRVDMPSRLGRLVIIPRLHEFLDEHPGIELEVGATDRFVDLVREGYDCVLRAGPTADSSLMAKKIGEMPIVNCVSQAYRRRYGLPKSLADLKNHFLVNYVGNFGAKPDAFEYLEGGQYKKLPMRSLITVNNADAYLAACLGGLGIIQSPRLRKETDMGKEIIEVLPQLKAEPMPVYFIYPHQRNLPLRVQAFRDWLEKILKDYLKP
jgi:DNA-binding transcriptional LysR family regulator